jgi:hypothetical protein
MTGLYHTLAVIGIGNAVSVITGKLVDPLLKIWLRVRV